MADTHDIVTEQSASEQLNSPTSDDGVRPDKLKANGHASEEADSYRSAGAGKPVSVHPTPINSPIKTEIKTEGKNVDKVKKPRTEKQLNALKEANQKKTLQKQQKVEMLKKAEEMVKRDEENKAKEAKKNELLELLAEVNRAKPNEKPKATRKRKKAETDSEDDDDDVESVVAPEQKPASRKRIPKKVQISHQEVEESDGSDGPAPPPTIKKPSVKEVKAPPMKRVKPAAPEAQFKPPPPFQKSKPNPTFHLEHAPERMSKLYNTIFS